MLRTAFFNQDPYRSADICCKSFRVFHTRPSPVNYSDLLLNGFPRYLNFARPIIRNHRVSYNIPFSEIPVEHICSESTIVGHSQDQSSRERPTEKQLNAHHIRQPHRNLFRIFLAPSQTILKSGTGSPVSRHISTADEATNSTSPDVPFLTANMLMYSITQIGDQIGKTRPPSG